VFHRFAIASGIALNRRSVRSTKPPFPDISCRVDGIQQYFELTRLVHPELANVMGAHLSQLSKTGAAPRVAAYCYDDRSALRETIGRSFKRSVEKACSRFVRSCRGITAPKNGGFPASCFVRRRDFGSRKLNRDSFRKA
jgi:hypothetical protein